MVGVKKALAFNGLEKINDLIVAKSINQKIEKSVYNFSKKNLQNISAVVQRLNLSNRLFSLDLNEPDDSSESFKGLQVLILRDVSQQSDYNDFIKLVSSTAAMSVKILAYGIYCLAITSIPFSSEETRIATYVIGPWWASSVWADRVVYDFMRSAVAKNPEKNIAIFSGQEKAGALASFVSYKYHEEINKACRKNFRTFYFCALTILTLYGSVWWNLQPSVSGKLLEKGKNHLPSKEELSKIDLKLPKTESLFEAL